MTTVTAHNATRQGRMRGPRKLRPASGTHAVAEMAYRAARKAGYRAEEHLLPAGLYPGARCPHPDCLRAASAWRVAHHLGAGHG